MVRKSGKNYEKEFKEAGIKIVYFPVHERGVSSTKIAHALNGLRGWASDASRKLLTEEGAIRI